MSSVIEFLERMGSEAQWRHASPDELEHALAEAGIGAPESAAILAKNAAELQSLLGQVPPFTVMVPPGEEEGEEDEDEEDDGDEKHELTGSRDSLSNATLQYA